MTAYEHLLRPGRIGSMELRNRLVMSPMETTCGTPEGLPSDRTVAYVAARAAGGVGLVTVGATGIDPWHPETPGGLHLGTDDAVAAHRRLARARCQGPAADRACRTRRTRPFGLVRQATEDPARAAYEWGRTSDRSRA